MMLRLALQIGMSVILCCAFTGAWGAGASSRVTYRVAWINRTRVHVIAVDMSDRAVTVMPALAHNTPGKRQSFVSFLATHEPLAQITGSYFSLGSALPIGDIVIDGKLRYQGPAGSALVIGRDGKASIVNIPYGRRFPWPPCESGLRGGVRLVQNGRFAVYPHDQGFRDPNLFRQATRTAVGLRDADHLLMVAVNKGIYLSELAAIMKELKCRDAMSLDGGMSTGLAFGTDVILMPGRMLSNVLIALPRPPVPPAPAGAPAPAVVPAPDPADAHEPPSTVAPAPPPADPTTEDLPPASASLVNAMGFRYSKARSIPGRALPLLAIVILSVPGGSSIARRRCFIRRYAATR